MCVCGGGVHVRGVLLNSHNLNYSALDCAIDFLLDRLTEVPSVGTVTCYSLPWEGSLRMDGRIDGWESVWEKRDTDPRERRV